MNHREDSRVESANRMACEKRMTGPEQAPRGSFVYSMKAVLWSFLGVRRGRDREQDFANLRPVPVLIAAFLCAAIFVGVLIAIVRAVVP